jgi:hypothetical protein
MRGIEKFVFAKLILSMKYGSCGSLYVNIAIEISKNNRCSCKFRRVFITQEQMKIGIGENNEFYNNRQDSQVYFNDFCIAFFQHLV